MYLNILKMFFLFLCTLTKTPLFIFGVGIEGSGHNLIKNLIKNSHFIFNANANLHELQSSNSMIYASPSWPYGRPAKYLHLTDILKKLHHTKINTRILLLTRNFNDSHWTKMSLYKHDVLPYEHALFLRKMLFNIELGLEFNRDVSKFTVTRLNYNNIINNPQRCLQLLSAYFGTSLKMASIKPGHVKQSYHNYTRFVGAESEFKLQYGIDSLC